MPTFVVKYDLEKSNFKLNNTKFIYIYFAVTTTFVLNIGLRSLYEALTFFEYSLNADLIHAQLRSFNAMMSLVTNLSIVLGLPSASKLYLLNDFPSQSQLMFQTNLKFTHEKCWFY